MAESITIKLPDGSAKQVPRGTTQILVRMNADRPRTVVTPTVVL